MEFVLVGVASVTACVTFCFDMLVMVTVLDQGSAVLAKIASNELPMSKSSVGTGGSSLGKALVSLPTAKTKGVVSSGRSSPAVENIISVSGVVKRNSGTSVVSIFRKPSISISAVVPRSSRSGNDAAVVPNSSSNGDSLNSLIKSLRPWSCRRILELAAEIATKNCVKKLIEFDFGIEFGSCFAQFRTD